MDKLKVPLSLISEEGYAVDVEVAASEISPPGTGHLSFRSVNVAGTLFEVDEEFLFRGVVSGEFRHACDRCLDEVMVPFQTAVFWSFVQGPPSRPWEDAEPSAQPEDESEGPGVYTYQGSEIDLAPQAWEEVVLAEPTKFLCREDCAGLCPQCGVNLNRETCACAKAPSPDALSDHSLAGLKQLMPKLKKKRTEE